MQNSTHESFREGKLPSKTIEVEKCTNKIKLRKETVTNSLKMVSDDIHVLDSSVATKDNGKLDEGKEIPQMDFLQNFKMKSDIIYLKLFPDYHPLSAEQQIFFVKLTEGIFGYNEQIRNEMLKVVAIDCNIRELVPYLCDFIKETIQCNIVFADLTLLIYSVRMTKSLLSNPHVSLKENLHKILPAILSCCLAKRISKYYYDNHWTLRDFSAYVIGMICNIYGNKYNNITQRVTNVYRRAIGDNSKPLTSIYGCIKGLGSLGDETVKSHILPYIPYVGKRLFMILERKPLYPDEHKQQVIEAKHVKDAILNTVCPILLKIKNVNDGGIEYVNEFGYLGHSLYMQMKNLEKIEIDKKQNQTMKFNNYNQYVNYVKNPNFVPTPGYIPRSVTNFGIQYVNENETRHPNYETVTLYGNNECNMFKANCMNYRAFSNVNNNNNSIN